jgi:hypothetical protein
MSETALTGADFNPEIAPGLEDHSGKAQRHIAAEREREVRTEATRELKVLSDIEREQLKDDLRRRILDGDDRAQAQLNALYQNDAASIAQRAEDRALATEVEESRPAPTPTIQLTPLEGVPEIPTAQQTHWIDTVRNAGLKNDKAASDYVNGWIGLANGYKRTPQSRPNAEAAERTLREKYGLAYEHNMAVANKKFGELFFDASTRGDIEYWLGTTPEFIDALYQLADYEHRHGAAPGIEDDSRQRADETPDQRYERLHDRARRNYARHGQKNHDILTVQG